MSKRLSDTYLRGTYQIRRDQHPDLVQLHADREQHPEQYGGKSFNEILIEALYMWLGRYQPKADTLQVLLNGQRQILQAIQHGAVMAAPVAPVPDDDKDDVIVGTI